MVAPVHLEPWFSSGGPGPNGLRQRAAVSVWVIGAVQTVAFGCCSALMGMVAMVPLEHFRTVTDLKVFEQLAGVYPLLGDAAMTGFVLGFLPGLAYLALGFAVRVGRGFSTEVAMVLAATQLVVFGTVFVSNLVVAVTGHSPSAATVNILTLGSLLALLGYGIRCLWLARQSRHGDWDESTDPWNDPCP